MAFNVQDDNGGVAAANAYITVQEFKDYHADRGNSTAGFSTGDFQSAIIRATDYLDTRFRYVGERNQGEDQATEWPRLDAENADGDLIFGIPTEVKEATAEYALLALNQALNPPPTRDPSGQNVRRTRSKVDVIETETEFFGSAGSSFSLPKYPLADMKLRRAGLVRSGKRLVRT